MQPSFEQYAAVKCAPEELKERLATLEPEASSAVQALIASLDPSANTLRSLLRLAEEISRRDGESLAAILTEPLLQQAAAHPGSRKERQKQVRRVLEARRYPELQRIRQQVESCRQLLVRDTGLRVEPPADLEGDAMTITLSVRHPEELAAAAEKLRALESHPALRELFAILRGEQ